jgi:hypothetical protein
MARISFSTTLKAASSTCPVMGRPSFRAKTKFVLVSAIFIHHQHMPSIEGSNLVNVSIASCTDQLNTLYMQLVNTSCVVSQHLMVVHERNKSFVVTMAKHSEAKRGRNVNLSRRPEDGVRSEAYPVSDLSAPRIRTLLHLICTL